MFNETIFNKLVEVLKKLLVPGAQISDANVNRLVKCITGMPDALINTSNLNRIVQLWFSQAVNSWEYNTPQLGLLTLALNFAVFLLTDEKIFIELQERGVLEKFIKQLKNKLYLMEATPDVGYVKLMTSFLEHEAGCRWMLSTNYWSEILSLTVVHSEQSSHLTSAKTAFIYKLLSASIDFNADFPLKIISFLLSPTIDFAELVNKKNSVDVKLFNQNCDPNLDLLELILESFMGEEKGEKEEQISKILDKVLAISEKYEFEKHAIDICLQSSNDEINFKLIKMIFLLRHLDMLCKTKNTSLLVYSDILPFIERSEIVRKKLHTHYQRFFPKIISSWIKCLSKCQLLLPKIKLTYGTIATFEQTLVHFQVMPAVSVNYYFACGVNYNFKEDESRDNYIVDQMLKKIPPVAYYQLYQIRDYMKDQFSFEYAIDGVECCIESLCYYTERQAELALICYVFCLEDFYEILMRNKELIHSDVAMKYLGSLMKVIKVIMKEFSFKWPETLEAMKLMEITLALLTKCDGNLHVTVNAFQLISVALLKHIPLGLSFPVCRSADRLVEKIIALATRKMNERNIEIKCSSIKVVEALTTMANKDFSSFQSLILKNELGFKVSQFFINDKDSKVRVSAIRCLQEITKVEELWNSILKKCDIYDYLCNTIYEDGDESVRSEVTTLIAIIYDHNDLTADVTVKFYDTISYIITEDTNATVRKKSLQFWKNVIEHHLFIEGMIDGEFPEVTFSKDSRKIVVLTDTEIKKCLVKVMHKLSDAGCLAAFKAAIQDSNAEVEGLARDMVTDLYKLLKKFDVQSFDLESYAAHFNNSFLEMSNLINVSGIFKGRHILLPKLFFEYIEEYLKPDSTISGNSKGNNMETILNEILYGSP